MAGKQKWELKHGFFAFYYNQEHPDRFSVRQIAEMLHKEYPTANDAKPFSKNSVDRMVDAIQKDLQNDPEVKAQYEAFKQADVDKPKYFYKWSAEGKIDSPYKEVLDKVRDLTTNVTYIPDALKGYLRWGEKFWQFVNRKKPVDWTIDEYSNFIATLSQGNKYSASVAIAQFNKAIKDIENRTKGLKGDPRKPPVMKSKEFPQIWQQIVKKTLELVPLELRKEMEFVLRVKPAIGARTGRQDRRKGLWGVKIGGEEKTPYGLASHVQIIGDSLVWAINEKGNQVWDINFFPENGLEQYIKNYVRSKKTGDWLIGTLTEAKANQFLKQGCVAAGVAQEIEVVSPKTKKKRTKIIDALRLHDMRKIYVSFLVRAGIPLEKAITLNVGWKDIATAYKHYLMFVDLGEKEAEYKRKLGVLFSGGASA